MKAFEIKDTKLTVHIYSTDLFVALLNNCTTDNKPIKYGDTILVRPTQLHDLHLISYRYIKSLEEEIEGLYDTLFFAAYDYYEFIYQEYSQEDYAARTIEALNPVKKER